MKNAPAKVYKDMTRKEVESFFFSVFGSRQFEKKMSAFNQFMYGQTGGQNDNGEFVIYKHDINRFLAGLPVID